MSCAWAVALSCFNARAPTSQFGYREFLVVNHFAANYIINPFTGAINNYQVIAELPKNTSGRGGYSKVLHAKEITSNWKRKGAKN